MNKTELKKLPQIDKCLSQAWAKKLISEFGKEIIKLELRDYFEEVRQRIIAGDLKKTPSEEEIAEIVTRRVKQLVMPEARHAINATGVILHTGLGRAPLSKGCASLLSNTARYMPVQIDLESGGRSRREEKIERMLKQLTGCESATVVTNNAAATFIILNTIASGKEVIISRGQLIEIGGSFRMPDVMAQSGCILKEVGTTNKTHLKDYEKAISEKTGAIIYVHPSNYKIQGFSGYPAVSELVALGAKYKLPVIADLGSGALVTLDKYGLSGSETIMDAISAGAEVTCSSGDKLIGGPQAGIICGKKEIIENIRSNPFARMFRVDKMILVALEFTLLNYIRGSYESKIPVYQMLSMNIVDLRKRANTVARALNLKKDLDVSVIDDIAYLGGGAMPEQSIPSKAVHVMHKNKSKQAKFAQEKTYELRNYIPMVVSRVRDNALIFDMRSLLQDDLKQLCQILNAVL